MIRQAQTLTLTSRAFYNDQLGKAEEYLCKLFGYDKVLLMNSGAEAVETAIKLARKWAYLRKGIETNKTNIVVAKGNFHGRTTGIISFSDSPESRNEFGSFLPGFTIVPYNNLQKKYPEIIKAVRGKGLLNAIYTADSEAFTAWDICLALKENGLLAKSTHGCTIRFSPPLIITSDHLDECCQIIEETISKFARCYFHQK